ncbi:MAG: hypothetical protein KJZ84_10280 [Bryobacteraceae bacterium]|nr:hypothetical protein [Bryobacteraceae bacterium]
MSDAKYYRSFLAAKAAGNQREMIRNAWRELDDPDDYGQPGFRYLADLAEINCDVNGLEELRRRGRAKIQVNRKGEKLSEELQNLLDSLDGYVKRAILLQSILRLVEIEPGVTKSRLHDTFHVYRTKADMLKGERKKRVEERVSEYVPTGVFDRLVGTPLMRVEGEGLDARFFLSGDQPMSIVSIPLSEPRSPRRERKPVESMVPKETASSQAGCLSGALSICLAAAILLLLLLGA